MLIFMLISDTVLNKLWEQVRPGRCWEMLSSGTPYPEAEVGKIALLMTGIYDQRAEEDDYMTQSRGRPARQDMAGQVSGTESHDLEAKAWLFHLALDLDILRGQL